MHGLDIMKLTIKHESLGSEFHLSNVVSVAIRQKELVGDQRISLCVVHICHIHGGDNYISSKHESHKYVQ